MAVRPVAGSASESAAFPDLSLGEYQLEFRNVPPGFLFTSPGIGDGDNDSNVDPATGRIIVVLTSDDPNQLHIDAGIRAESAVPSTPAPSTPSASPAPGLPDTGADGDFTLLMLLAGMLIAVGAGLTVRSARRAR